MQPSQSSRKRSKNQAPPPATHSLSHGPGEFFVGTLLDMGTLGAPEMAGIFTPEAEVGLARIGISSQFLEDASVYHAKYTNTSYFKTLLATALSRIDAPLESPRILDIGSGSGNTVFPCLELFPDCRIVATDLSPNLLRILLEHAEKHASAAGRLVPVCMDATRDYYKPGAFDLVIGAAILHHLIDPGAAISAAGRALAPGGHAVFFEPFENGSAILRLAYTEILTRDAANQREPASAAAPVPLKWRAKVLDRLLGVQPAATAQPPNKTGLSEDVRNLLQSLINEYALRSGSDKSDPIFQKIDDKWLFTRTYIESRAKEAGFSEITVYPLIDVERQFTRQTEVFLSLGIGAQPSALPNWAWQILDSYDRMFSRELKQELIIEGAIILKKG